MSETAIHDRTAHRQVAAVENFISALYALPKRFADSIAGMHPYDVADALRDMLDVPHEEPLAPWEVELLRCGEDDTERLRRARQALVATGYFKADEIGEDIAPRITELHAAFAPSDPGDAAGQGAES